MSPKGQVINSDQSVIRFLNPNEAHFIKFGVILETIKNIRGYVFSTSIGLGLPSINYLGL